MKNYLSVLIAIYLGLVSGLVSAAPLITTKEAALPAASGTLATRGISRGPAVKLSSPEADVPVSSPFDFKVLFEARGEGKIDPNSVKVVYMKSPFVDLTPRLKPESHLQALIFQKRKCHPEPIPLELLLKILMEEKPIK